MNRQEFFPQGVELSDKITPEYADILTPHALEFVAKLARHFDSRRRELLARRVQRQIEIASGKLPDFLPETADVRAGDWVVAPVPADLQDRRVEITGPMDRKMVINALNSRCERLHGGLRGLEHADLAERRPRSDQPEEGDRAHAQLRLRRRQALRPRRQDCHADGAPSRLAPGGEAREGRRRARRRRVLRFRPLLLPQREGTARARYGSLLLPAEDGEPPGGAALERRLQLRPGRAQDSPRNDQGDGADRDRPRRIRDGRDPVRVA